VKVELLLVPQCPNADQARTVLAESLRQAGLAVDVVQRIGEYPSPTMAVNDVDVMTGQPVTAGTSACRLDLPTTAAVVTALRAATRPVELAETDAYPPQLAVGVTSDRLASVSVAGRTLHKAILADFAATGTPPDQASLAEVVPDGALDICWPS
jgi:hypothetical protein